jgi:CRP-like cAMP-binding protein
MQYFIPSFYLDDMILDFEATAQKYALVRHHYKRGDILTTAGTINNTAYYFCSGIVHLSLIHSSGNRKGMFLFGHGTIFPIGVVPHENPIDYEMILRATTDVDAYAFPYPILRQMCVENGELAAQILEENCRFVGYLFYQAMNQSYASTFTRVCDVLYLQQKIQQESRRSIQLTQSELAELTGASVQQLERALKRLREAQIIQTSRKSILVKDMPALLQNCSDELKTYN